MNLQRITTLDRIAAAATSVWTKEGQKIFYWPNFFALDFSVAKHINCLAFIHASYCAQCIIIEKQSNP